MDRTELLKAACRETAARIDARIRDKLLKRARKQGMANEREVLELIEAWKRAASVRTIAPPGGIPQSFR